MTPLTEDQLATIRELRGEIKDLNLEADEQWAQYLKTSDPECWDAVQALEGEIVLKSMIAHLPTAGERKIGKVRKLLRKARGTSTYDREFSDRDGMEARIRVLESINAWREDLKLPPLDRLPRSIPGDSHECLIARVLVQTGEDLGLSDVGASVDSGSNMSLWGEDEDGGIKQMSGLSFEYASTLIGGFDNFETMYLDVIETDALVGRVAQRIGDETDADEGNFNADNVWQVVEETHHELVRRGEDATITVSLGETLSFGRGHTDEEVKERLRELEAKQGEGEDDDE